MNKEEENDHSNVSLKANALCTEVDAQGYATIHEGSTWLSSSNEMIERQKEHSDNSDSPYSKFNFDTHPYWLEIIDADPFPIRGPQDSFLLETLEWIYEYSASKNGLE